jgi:arylsulfatase A-like enzyme
MVMNVDFAPTILDFGGVPVPSGMQGRSLRPLMEGRSPEDWRQSTYYAYYENSWELVGKGEEAMAEPFRYFTPHRVGPHRGVRTSRYKLIEYYGEGDYWELFDLEADPDELANRYPDPAYADVVDDLKAELLRVRRTYRDLG